MAESMKFASYASKLYASGLRSSELIDKSSKACTFRLYPLDTKGGQIAESLAERYLSDDRISSYLNSDSDNCQDRSRDFLLTLPLGPWDDPSTPNGSNPRRTVKLKDPSIDRQGI